MLVEIAGKIDYVICPFCGSKVVRGICYTCGNTNLPDLIVEDKK